jgi:hypothetical protein
LLVYRLDAIVAALSSESLGMIMCSSKSLDWVANIASQNLGALAAKQQEQKPKTPAARGPEKMLWGGVLTFLGRGRDLIATVFRQEACDVMITR